MRVFLTGATGFIGSAILDELAANGHEALGLARTDAAAETLAGRGVAAYRGDLSDPAGLAAAAKTCDGVIHTAFIHDFSKFLANIETDRLAVQAMVGALKGSGKPMIIASGTFMVASDRVATEEDRPAPGAMRGESEEMVRGARWMRGAVVRLAPTVHGAGDHGFVPRLIAFAREKGFAAYVGEGANRWPAVHRLDAARLFRLGLEKAPAGAALHAAAESGIAMRAIARAIGEGLGLPVRSLTPDEAPAYFDWMARFAAMDGATSSALTQERLGWRPEGPDLLTDMRENGYFA